MRAVIAEQDPQFMNYQ